MKKPLRIAPTLGEILIEEARLAREFKTEQAAREGAADDKFDAHVRTFVTAKKSRESR